MNEEKLIRLKYLTLLLVEDDEVLLSKLQTILSIFFKEVLTALNGQEALAIYKKQKVDMIISDYTMPIMSGYELFETIRKENKTIPLTIISNYTDTDKLLNSIPLSLAYYLVKPVYYDTLTATLLKMIERLDDANLCSYQISENITYDNMKNELQENGKKVALSKSEIIALELFLKNSDKIITQNQLELHLDPEHEKSDQAIKSLIYRLRKKLGKDKILNISGIGYIFKKNPYEN